MSIPKLNIVEWLVLAASIAVIAAATFMPAVQTNCKSRRHPAVATAPQK